MGSSFSAEDYKNQVTKFFRDYLTHDDSTTLSNFLMQSEDFANVFTTATLDDFRRVKTDKMDNLVYLMSYVSEMISLTRVIR